MKISLKLMSALIIVVFTSTIFCKANSFESENVDLSKLTIEQLLDITIETAGKIPEKISEVPASVLLISREEIEKYGYKSITDILQNITGLFITDDYYWLGTQNFGVRGFYSSGPFNNIIILHNGINQMEDYTRGTPFSKINIPIESIDRIEVVRGPMSVIYGSGAFLGAINIITNLEAISTSKVSYGANNTSQIELVFSKNIDDLLIKFAGGYNNSDGLDLAYTELTSNPINDENGKTFLENNGLKNDSRTKNQLYYNSKYASLSTKFSNFEFDLSINSTEGGMMDGQPTLGDGSYYISNTAIASVHYLNKLSESWQLNISSAYSHYNYYNNYEQDYLNTNMNSNQISSFFETEINSIYSQNENLLLLSGISSRLTTDYRWAGDYEPWGKNFENFLTEIKKPYALIAPFVQLTYHFNHNFTLIGGLRAEYSIPIELVRINDYNDSVHVRPYTYKQNQINLIPRIALLYNVNSNNIIKLFYGTANKQPALSDLHQFCYHPDWKSLENSKINTIELNYINNYFNKLTGNFSIFYNNIDNLITRKDIFDSKTGELKIESTNAGKMKSIGTEFEIVYKPYHNLIIGLSGTYQFSEDLTEGMKDITPAYSPKILAYGRVLYQINDKYSIAIISRYVDKMYSYYDNTSIDPNKPSLGKVGRIGNESPAYLVADINMRIDNLYKNVFCELKISNIFDQEIRYPVTTANIWMDKGALGRGRALMATLGVKL